MLSWASQQFEKFSQTVAPPPADANGRFVYCVQQGDEDGAMGCVSEIDAARTVLKPTKGSYAIHLACQNSMDRLIRLLLSQPGVDLTYIDSHGNTPLHYATMSTDKGRALATTKMLVSEFRASVVAKNSAGQTPYDLASLDMVRQYLLPLQLQEETRQAIDNGGIGLPPGIDMGGIRIANPAQPPPPIMNVHPAPAPMSSPVQHAYQVPQHDIPMPPTSGQHGGYARSGSSSAAIYKPADKRYYKADGFHSSSSDVNLQRKYGHVQVQPRAGVPPPPSSGNVAGSAFSPSGLPGPNPFAGGSNPYASGRTNQRYVAYDPVTGKAVPMPSRPLAPSSQGYGQPTPSVAVFSPGGTSTPVAHNLFNPMAAQTQTTQGDQLQGGSQSAGKLYQGQSQPTPPFGYGQPPQQQATSPAGDPYVPDYGQKPQFTSPFAAPNVPGYGQHPSKDQQQQPSYGSTYPASYPGAQPHGYQQPQQSSSYPDAQAEGIRGGQQPTRVAQNHQGAQSPASPSGGLLSSPGDANAAAALFSPQQVGASSAITASDLFTSPPRQAKEPLPAASVSSGSFSPAAQAANAASASALFSSPVVQNIKSNKTVSDTAPTETQSPVAVSGGSFSPAAQAANAASASALFSSPVMHSLESNKTVLDTVPMETPIPAPGSSVPVSSGSFSPAAQAANAALASALFSSPVMQNLGSPKTVSDTAPGKTQCPVPGPAVTGSGGSFSPAAQGADAASASALFSTPLAQNLESPKTVSDTATAPTNTQSSAPGSTMSPTAKSEPASACELFASPLTTNDSGANAFPDSQPPSSQNNTHNAPSELFPSQSTTTDLNVNIASSSGQAEPFVQSQGAFSTSGNESFPCSQPTATDLFSARPPQQSPEPVAFTEPVTQNLPGQSAFSTSGIEPFPSSQPSAVDMFSAPSPQQSPEPVAVAASQGWGVAGPAQGWNAPSSTVPVSNVAGPKTTTAFATAPAASSTAAELFTSSSPSPAAELFTSSSPSPAGTPQQGATIVGQSNQDEGSPPPQQNERAGSPSASDEMLDDVPLSPEGKSNPTASSPQASQASSANDFFSQAPPVQSHTNSIEATTNPGPDSLFAAIGMPPPPFSKR